MHISSLSSPYGIGTMGKEAYEFVDFLEESGQACWQLLPVCPTSYGDSPYQSYSTLRVILILLIWIVWQNRDYWKKRIMKP